MSNKKAGSRQPGHINQPLPERTKMIIAKREGPGPAAKLNPDPHTKHIPKQKVQGVRE